jgi:hypothetical protein
MIKPFQIREPGHKWVLIWAEDERQAVRNYLDEYYPGSINQSAWSIVERHVVERRK